MQKGFLMEPLRRKTSQATWNAIPCWVVGSHSRNEYTSSDLLWASDGWKICTLCKLLRELAPKAVVATNRNNRFVTKYVITLGIGS